MRIMVLGGDGYLGWPTAMQFSRRGHEVAVVDNLAKRHWEAEVGAEPLWTIPPIQRRIGLWREVAGKSIRLYVGDIAENHQFAYHVVTDFQPDIVIHYAEQPSAPYSMRGRMQAVYTQRNNICGTLNILFALKREVPHCHLVKLGTMGEYGTPNIDIEEGFIDIEHKGRKDRLPFPKQANSFYHWSKVHDSGNIMFACRTWGLRSTDLNQGVVYGIDTDETALHDDLRTSFHYDETFGTVINRFCVEAVAGMPLTVYGGGGQRRGFLNIRDTLQCVTLAVENPPQLGEYRVFNQFTEVFSIQELAQLVKIQADASGIPTTITSIENPRTEREDHYYNPINESLLKLGLKPHLLSDELLNNMMRKIAAARHLINAEVIPPSTKWEFSRAAAASVPR